MYARGNGTERNSNKWVKRGEQMALVLDAIGLVPFVLIGKPSFQEPNTFHSEYRERNVSYLF